ncbi:MAG: hypothetical protein Q8928_10280 [Bacteroidota bacterium]|nr:hypothetical protein [Bacteroidota bacterium]
MMKIKQKLLKISTLRNKVFIIIFLTAIGGKTVAQNQLLDINSSNSNSLFNGLPDIKIPLYEFKEKSMNIPVFLNYDASGNKVETVASNIGLGWTLYVGGQINRIVKGIPDDYYMNDNDNLGVGWIHNLDQKTTLESSFFGLFKYDQTIETAKADISNVINNPNFLERSNSSIWSLFNFFTRYWLDTEPDIFSFDIPGHKGEFYFDKDGKISPINGNGLIFSYSLDANKKINEFDITDENGNKYIYSIKDQKKLNLKGVKKFTFVYAMWGIPFESDNLVTTFYDTWHLSKIISSNGTEINYHYATENYTLTSLVSSYKKGIESTETNNYSQLLISNCFNRLTQISSDNIEMNFSTGTERRDLPGTYPINGITVVWKPTRTFIKNYFFEQNYFLSSTSTPSEKSLRLKLNSIQELSRNGQSPPPISFFYDEEDKLPPRDSKEQDIWGYYNANHATTLIPKIYVYGSDDFNPYKAIPIPNCSADYVINGADRSPDIRNINGKIETVMDAFILTQIKTSEGGVISYQFEPHEYAYDGHEYRGGGLRISKIAYSDGTTTNQIVKEFKYSDPIFGSNGVLINMPIYAYINYGRDANSKNKVQSEYFNNRNNFYQNYLNVTSDNNLFYYGNPIGYSKVEVNQSGKGSTAYYYEINSSFNDLNKTRIVNNLIEDPYAEGILINGDGSDDVETCGSLLGTSYKLFCKYEEGPNLSFFSFNIFPFPSNGNSYWNNGFLTYTEQKDELGNLTKTTGFAYSDKFISGSKPNIIYGLRYAMHYNPVYIEETGTCGLYGKICAECDKHNGNPQYIYGRYSLNSGMYRVLESVNETFYDLKDVNKFNSTTTTYKYNDVGQVSLVSQIQSNGSELKTTYSYPCDFNFTTTINGVSYPLPPCENYAQTIYNMQTKNIIKPIEVVKYFNNKVIDARLYTYSLPDNYLLKTINKINIETPLSSSNFTRCNLGLTFCQSSNSYLGTSGAKFLSDGKYQPYINYDYDANGNILQYHEANNINTAYIWGYNSSLPVAKVANASQNEIFFTSFDDGMPVIDGWAVNTSLDATHARTGKYALKSNNPSNSLIYHFFPKLTINNSSDKKYRYSCWVYSSGPQANLYFFWKDNTSADWYAPSWNVDHKTTTEINKWVLLQGEVTVPANAKQIYLRADNMGSGTVWFDDLRLCPADSKMTTYTHAPLVGMTSSTDENNISTFYEYDSLGRLMNTRDKDQNILNHYEYHYKQQ